MCKVSVVIPVYNVGFHIEETIRSLLAQTFTDFELLVLDDCSTDDTYDRVAALATQDSRIRLSRNACNLGRAGTDNAALALVRGEFIAKMDGDDICHPTRLAKQVAFLQANPEVNVVGAWMQNFEASNYLNRYPTNPDAAQVLTLFTLPTGNSSSMLRTSLFREQGLRYDASLRQTEDYDFFARYIRQLRVVSLPEALIRYRVPPDTLKQTILSERATVADEVRERLLRAWEMDYSPRELRIHQATAFLSRPRGDLSLTDLEGWLQKLLRHNQTHPLFEQEALRRGLAERWFEVCYAQPLPRLAALRQFGQSQLAAYFTPSSPQRLKFWARSLRGF